MAQLTQSLSSKTETNIIIKWTADEKLSKLWYSIDNGTTFIETEETGDNGSVYINDLTPYTTYSIVLKGKVQSTSENILSPVLEVQTYNYPFCNMAPDFTIGDRLALLFYNPLKHEITVNLLGDDGSIISNDTITGNVLTGFFDEITIDRLYQSLPNKQKANYYVKVTYEDNTPLLVEGGVYSVDLEECAPLIGDVSYKDISSVVSITGDNQYIVRNQSLPEFTATGISAQKHATVSSVKVKLNEEETVLTLNSGTATGTGNYVDSFESIDATFIVTDSRGVKTEKKKLVNIYDWFMPSARFYVERTAQDSSTCTATASAYYASVGEHNNVTMTCYKKKDGDTEYTEVGSMTHNVPITFEADADYDWFIKIVITDSFGSSNESLELLNRYVPIAYVDSENYSVGINCMPQHENTLEVKGEDIYAALFYSKAETFSITDKLYCPGILIYNEVFFTIPLPRSAKNVTPTLTTLKINACKNSSGFLFTNSYTTGGYNVLTASGLTTTVTKAIDNQLMVKIHSSSSISETNMTQVIVELDDVIVTFT